MAYTPIGWLNDQAPAINAANLNKMDNGLVVLDSTIDVLSEKESITAYPVVSTTKTNLNASGQIREAEGTDYKMYYAEVKKGYKYEIITNDASEQLICGFFVNEPQVYDYSYNRERIVQESMFVVAPIDGYIAFRSVEPKTTEEIKSFSAVDYVSRAMEPRLSAVESTVSNHETRISENEINIAENSENIDALIISEDKKVILTQKLENTGSSSSIWFNLDYPTGYKNLYFAYTDIGGVNLTQSTLVLVKVRYTTGSDTEIILNERNKLYKIPIDTERTINKLNVILYRGSMPSGTYSFVDIAIYGQNIPDVITDIMSMNDLRYFDFENAVLGNNGKTAAYTRLCFGLLKFDGTVVISADDGYSFGFVTYSDLQYGNMSDSGWITGTKAFATDQFFGINFRKNNNGVITQNDKNAIKIQMIKNANDVANSFYKGFHIDTHKNLISASKSTLTRAIPSGYTTQAGAIYGDYLIQGYSNNSDGLAYLELYNLNNDSRIYGQEIDVKHFGSATFSNEFYNANDPMPLLYITGLNGYLYVVRVTEENATIIRTIATPQLECGYNAGACVDSWKNYLYVFGYFTDSYRDPTNNGIKVSIFNLGNLTENDGIYTAELVDRFEIPFIYCFQDFAFYRGKIFISSGFNTSEHISSILVFNPATRAIETEITISEIQTEPEMIDFRAIDNKDVLYFQAHRTFYIIIDFV